MVEKETLHVRYCPYCPEHSKALLRDPTKVMSEDWWAGTKSSTPCTRTYINKHVLTASSRKNIKSINQSITNKRKKQKKETKQTNNIHPAPHPSPYSTRPESPKPRGICPSTRSSVPSENRSITGANKPKETGHENKDFKTQD